MSLRASSTRLTALTRDLAVKWSETKYHWRDVKSDEFEKKYLEELFPAVDRTVALMEQLGKLLGKIKDECE
jgi:hypothetical protein